MSNQTNYVPSGIAWDIETAPMPLSVLTERQRRRLRLEYKEQARRDPQKSVTKLVRKSMSFHGFLCWICCISLAWRDEDGALQTMTLSAERPVEERRVIHSFWEGVHPRRPGRQRMNWITFNGKNFDCGILRTRSLRNEVEITNQDVLDEYPYSYTPHCDVATMWRDEWNGLADAADLFGISYESEIGGGEVAAAVANDRIDLVEQHCEADAKTTLRVYEHAATYTPELP